MWVHSNGVPVHLLILALALPWECQGLGHLQSMPGHVQQVLNAITLSTAKCICAKQP